MRLFLSALSALGVAAAIVPASARVDRLDISRVLLVSVDGLHASDLTNYVAQHPSSTMAALAQHATIYPNALTTQPSDSFPGLVAQVTGGTPKSVGVYYDVSYDRTLFAPGSQCKGAPGTQPAFDESIDLNSTIASGGGTLGQPLTQIDWTKLPMMMKGKTCVPVYPHDFIKVNTIFEVIRSAGKRTAWSDKHPAYDIVNGPSGSGVIDLFTPEVDSNDALTGQDTTAGFHSIQRNDELKVQAILNEIAGKTSTGQAAVGVPAIFGMNFQAVSVGQKLAVGNAKDPQDAGLIGGYADAAGAHPNNGLQSGLDYVDSSLGRMVSALQSAGLLGDTLIIVSAKHGQSPIDHAQRTAVSDSPYTAIPGYGASITDDVGLVWLTPSLQRKDYDAAEAYLKSKAAVLGITELLDRRELARLYRNPLRDDRTPDFVAVTKQGLIYTSGSKLAEHGGFAHDDRNVALLLSNPALSAQTVQTPVETRQIAPTILSALGLSPNALEAVRIEHTQALPQAIEVSGR